MNRLALYGLLAALLIALGAVPTYLMQHAKVRTLTSQLEQATATAQATNKALLVERQRKQELKRTNDTLTQRLNDAFQQNPEWAGTPVPDAVYDSLFPSTP